MRFMSQENPCPGIRLHVQCVDTSTVTPLSDLLFVQPPCLLLKVKPMQLKLHGHPADSPLKSYLSTYIPYFQWSLCPDCISVFIPSTITRTFTTVFGTPYLF